MSGDYLTNRIETVAGLAPVVVLVLLMVGSAGADIVHHSLVQTVSPSVRANGMAEAGVALVDRYAVYHNPAALGFFHRERRAAFNIYPLRAALIPELDEDVRLSHVSLSLGSPSAVRIGKCSFSAGIGYHRSKLTVPDLAFWWTATPEDLHSVVDNFSLGVASTGAVEVAVGVTYKRLTAEHTPFDAMYDPSRREVQREHGHAFDYGLLLRREFRLSERAVEGVKRRVYLTVTAGASWSNYGPDWNWLYVDEADRQPRIRRQGAAVQVDRRVRDRELYHLLVSYEYEELLPSSSSYHKVGLELAVYETVAARVGRFDDGHHPYHTYGFSVSSRELTRRLRGSEGDSKGEGYWGWIFEHVTVEYSLARTEDDDELGSARRTFHGLSVVVY